MFTGIIEELGIVIQINHKASIVEYVFRASKILSGISLGDSIAVNGTCLTVTSFTANDFSVDVMNVTSDVTNIKYLAVGSVVNLERAMLISSRIGGHMLSGHVDGVAKIINIIRDNQTMLLDIDIPREFSQYCINKGSIAINGVSLTIAKLVGNIVTVSLIPHTIENTIFQYQEVGDVINVEYDMMIKQINSTIRQMLVDGKLGEITCGTL